MNLSPLHSARTCLEPSARPVCRAALRRCASRWLALALIATFGVSGLSDPGRSQSAPAKAAPAKEERGLEGSWSGGGSVSFAAGSREQARCRAHYSRASKNSYRVNATCATASGKAAQTATVHKVGENKYSGNFHNPDYDISGTISVIVNGNSQSVRLTSSSGWAVIRLSR
jgi:hypothetical protein